MGMFGGRDGSVTTTFNAKDNMSPVVRGIRRTMDQFKRDAKTGFGLAGGISIFNMATQALGAVTDYMGDALTAASDLGEQTSKNTVVFGDQADEVIQWARELDSSFGLSERAALTLTGQVGNLGVSMGLSSDEASDMARGVAELAGDLASFNNADIKDVMIALQSGLVGETEPMRKFGVDLSAAAVNAKALAMGLADTEKSLTGADKVQARYALMMEKTATAQGDAARTADTLAGRQRQFNAEMGNLQTKVGDLLVGPATDFLGFLSGIVDVIDGPSGASASIRDLTGTIVMLRGQTDALTKGSPFERLESDLAGWNQELKANEELYKNDTWFKWVAALGPDTLRNFGKAGAETMADVRALAQGVIDAGGSFGEFASIVRQKVAPSFNILTSTWGRGTQAIADTDDVVRKTVDRWFVSLDEAKGPWKSSWQSLAAWAKDPFKPDSFENWIRNRIRAAFRKAKQAEEANAPGEAARWRRIGRSMKLPIVQAQVAIGLSADEILSDLEAVSQAGLRAMSIIPLIGGLGELYVPNVKPPKKKPKKPKKNRAMGGSFSDGDTLKVGENGPEVITLSGGGGRVTPNHHLNRPIVINVDGRRLFEITDARSGRAIAMGGA